MKTPAILLNSLLPIESVQLGRFVANAMQPHQDFLDLPVGPQSKDILIKHHENFKDILNHSRNSKVRSRLTALLSISYHTQGTSTATLIAEKATTYQLLNSGSWLENACAADDTRTWLEKCLEYTEDVYLVVGYYALTNPSCTQKSTFGGSTGGDIQLSVGAGGAVPSLVQNTLGARVNSLREVNNQRECTFSGSGEQIYAVQYRKLRFSWYSSRDIKNSFLEPNNRWKVFWEAGARGEESEDEGEDDVLEVDFADEFDIGFDEVYVGEDGIEELMD